MPSKKIAKNNAIFLGPVEQKIVDLTDTFRSEVASLAAISSPIAKKNMVNSIERTFKEISGLVQDLDLVRLPGSVFDPADPGLFGSFAALAMIGQDRQPLDDLNKRPFYGAGIYAIYYKGDYPLYAPIRGTETPVYVGKADPSRTGENNPKGQGTTLHGRLVEHMKNIRLAKESIDIADFECRYLVVASGWQAAAESALIKLFNPIWNKETKILLGFGKHGDDHETRGHARSPWDTLHPGRPWAAKQKTDQKSLEEIDGLLKKHFNKNPPVVDAQQVLHDLIGRIRS